MNYDLLIVAALKQESRGEFEKLGFPVIYTGVGKLNAAFYSVSQTLALIRVSNFDNPTTRKTTTLFDYKDE